MQRTLSGKEFKEEWLPTLLASHESLGQSHYFPHTLEEQKNQNLDSASLPLLQDAGGMDDALHIDADESSPNRHSGGSQQSSESEYQPDTDEDEEEDEDDFHSPTSSLKRPRAKSSETISSERRYKRRKRDETTQILESSSYSPASLEKLRRNANLNIWDCAGQSEFYAAQEIFLSRHSLFIIVVSMDDPNSLTSAEKWAATLNSREDLEGQIMMVVTKSDKVLAVSQGIISRN